MFNMTPEFEKLIKQSVKDGYCETPREAVEEALYLLQQKITETERKKTKIRAMIQEGIDSGLSERTNIEDIIAQAEVELDQEAQDNG